ncbi:MAG: cysteine hydrolase family protein [Candidatus Dormibacteria bacterium]
MKSTSKIAAARAAVVFIEPQRDFLSPRGTVYAFIKNEVARRKVVDNLGALLAGAREKGVRVIYAPFRPFERESPEAKPGGTVKAELVEAAMTPRIEHIREHHRIGYRDEGEVCLECGHAWPCDTAVAMEEIGELRHRSALLGIDELDSPEFIPQLRPRTGDIIVEGNKTLDAFHSTELDYLLRANEIQYVAFVGFHTNCCVESSARSAYDRGYRVIVVSDCTGTDTDEEQRYAETFIFPRIGQVMTAAEFLLAVESASVIPVAFLG